MSARFAGHRVALLEVRHGDAAAALVQRMGGVPVSAPALREEPMDARPQVTGLIDALERREVQLVVFLTGVAGEHLVSQASAAGARDRLLAALSRSALVVRGPKAAAALVRVGLRPTLAADAPHTTGEVLDALAPVDLRGAGVAILHYGEVNRPLSASLRARGARVTDVVLYEWKLPSDTRPLDELVEGLIAGRVDAIAFTSQIQARHLFAVAGPQRTEPLRRALRTAVVGAIGPVCADVLAELDVAPSVVPAQHKLQPLLASIAEALTKTSRERREERESAHESTDRLTARIS